MSRRDSRPEYRDRDDRRNFNGRNDFRGDRDRRDPRDLRDGRDRERDRRDIRDVRDVRDYRDNRDAREAPRREPVKIDREKVCPTLVRVFTKDDRNHSAEDFKDGKLPSAEHEIQIHTWQDATLRELTTLIQSVRDQARATHARLLFNLVTVDRSGIFSVRPMGSIYATRQARDEDKTLHELGFEAGDYIDVAIVSRS